MNELDDISWIGDLEYSNLFYSIRGFRVSRLLVTEAGILRIPKISTKKCIEGRGQETTSKSLKRFFKMKDHIIQGA